MVELVIHTGKHQGKRLSIPAAEVFIGRDEDCQIRLASTDVSRKHCRLQVSDTGVTVRDLESRNGTFVNDMPISGDVVLKPGDLLRVGPMILQVPLPKAVGAPADPVAEVVHAAAPVEAAATRAPAPKASVPAAAAPRKAAALPQGNRRNKLTDDDIANWLTDDDSGVQNSGDTTIVSGRSAKKAADDAPAPPPKVEKKQFSSVAEEAADIIRRHWEAVRANKK